MKTVSKRFTVNANQNILELNDLLTAMDLKTGGTFYSDQIKAGRSIICSYDIFVDSDVQLEMRSKKGKTSAVEDMIAKKVYSSVEDEIAEILPKANVSGLIFLRLS